MYCTAETKGGKLKEGRMKSQVTQDLKYLPNLTVMMTKLEQVLEMLEVGRKIIKAN